MTYELDLSAPTWNLMPASTAEEIIQNVRCILLTVKATCPLYRDFGIDPAMLDKPLNVAKNKFIKEVVGAVAKYEPRAHVKSVQWQKPQDALDGTLNPRITIEIRG